MRQSCAATLATEEPDALIAHVRVCGGAGWVTIGSTRKRTGHTTGFFSRWVSVVCGPPLTAGVRCAAFYHFRRYRCVIVASLLRHVPTFPEFDGKNRSVLLADFSHSYSRNGTSKTMGHWMT
jgi:hypothetical protein